MDSGCIRDHIEHLINNVLSVDSQLLVGNSGKEPISTTSGKLKYSHVYPCVVMAPPVNNLHTHEMVLQANESMILM